MAVHVDEVHTQVATSAPARAATTAPADVEVSSSGSATAPPAPLGASEEAWRRTEARVRQLRCRVAAEGFDD